MSTRLIRIDPELDERFQKLAQVLGRSKQECIHQALSAYLDQYEWVIETMGHAMDHAKDESLGGPPAMNAGFSKWGVDL